MSDSLLTDLLVFEIRMVAHSKKDTLYILVFKTSTWDSMMKWLVFFQLGQMPLERKIISQRDLGDLVENIEFFGCFQYVILPVQPNISVQQKNNLFSYNS